LVGKPEGKIPFGRPRHGWEDDIKVWWGGGGVWAGWVGFRIRADGRDL
jgi:hypothetical protein